MASFATENTQDNVFLLLRSKDTFMEFRLEGNKSRECSTAEKVDINGFKSDELFFKDISLLEPGHELRTSNGVFRTCK